MFSSRSFTTIRSRPRIAKGTLAAAAAVAVAVTGLTIGGHEPGVAPRQAAATQTVNPWWQLATELAQGKHQGTGDVFRAYPKAAAATPDDGIVLFRLFIPAAGAAGNMLLGDNRGFSADPGAVGRGVVIWDTATGNVSLLVSHSSRQVPVDKPYVPKDLAALPLTAGTDWNAAFAVRDKVRNDNRIGITSQPDSLKARVSLLNPLTNNVKILGNDDWNGAWSVDYELTITRTGPATYTLQMNANGYPAVEAYYYPKYADSPSQQSKVIAKRAVAPLFVNQQIDTGGGAAARDWDSWNACANRAGKPTVFDCHNTVPFSHANDWPWVVWHYPEWPPPTEQQWTAPWSTDASATKAM